MGIRLRVRLPDQPGALARVAQAIAAAGADVVSVKVLDSEGGRAVDDFRLRWPDQRDLAPLITALGRCRGVELVACGGTEWVAEGRPDLDLLACLLADPRRGLKTLVDMAPAALDGDWAELRAPARRLPALYVSTGRPHDEVAPEAMPVRGIAWGDDTAAIAYLPVLPIRSVLVVGRDTGPAFLRSEIAHSERVLALAMRALDSVLSDAGSEATLDLAEALVTAAPTG
jgi:hypothetical protein